jgi:L-Lysine epsilon oxidase N-terminal/L-lysine epsilon oxidase C-terminal domain
MIKKEPRIPECFDTSSSATQRLVEMFVEIAQARRTRNNPPPAERAVFRKLHGAAHAWLERRPDVPEAWRVGVFAHERLEAWVRFSSDAAPTDPDLGTTLGVGIKLFGLPGEKSLGDAGDTADFILQNASRFFVDDAKEMVEFTYAGVVQQDYTTYLAHHPKTNDILNAMTAPRGSVLTSTYWALLPFHLGAQVVKYRLEPHAKPEDVPDDAPDYLSTDMTNRLAQGEYRFTLSVQLRTNDATMPLDRATVEWPESESPFVPVATLVIPRQGVCAPGQAAYGQALSFNIWRVPHDNRPSEHSSIAVARRDVYAAGAAMRHQANGQPLQDPAEPRQAAAPPPGKDDCIVQAVIYPSIGVARVGNSDETFIGPEVTDPEPLPPGSYRDAHKRLKRQAARFRVYGCNARGEIIRELTSQEPGVEIDWRVELANKKSAWFGFQLALDIPEANYAPPTTLRNPGVSDRSQLAITPGARRVKGRNAGPERFDDGRFMGKPVYLGELLTDEDGRLIVVGGKGQSSSHDGSAAITFANNEGWYDDVSDGPVDAKVVLHGQALQVVPAWVVVAPPNYGPQRKSVRTMWDLMRDLAIKANQLPAVERPSFTFDILPLFERLAGLQWVNAGFAAGFGWGGAFDLTSPEVLAALSSTEPTFRERRRVIANNFRQFSRDGVSPVPWPWLYGDAMNIPPAPTPRQNAALSDCQLGMLEAWAEGNFEADWDPGRKRPRSLDEVPVAEQGDMLTRAALEFCLADAFHPGCEMTWPVRAQTLYMAPFRFLHAPEGWIEPAQSEVLTTDSVTIPNGPLYGQLPGGITRWMAVPWQTDTSSCRSGYTPTYDPYAPSFWPARVPNQVLSESNYAIVMDKSRPLSERRKAFANREAWIEPLGSDGYTHQINNMIQHFDFLAVVEVKQGPGDAEFPEVIEVADWSKVITPEEETYAAAKSAGGHPTGSAVGSLRRAARSAADVDLRGIDLVNRFPNGLPPQSR